MNPDNAFKQGFMDALDEGILKEALAEMMAKAPGIKSIASGRRKMSLAGAATPTPKMTLKPTVNSPSAPGMAPKLISSVRAGMTKASGFSNTGTSRSMGLMTQPKPQGM